MWDQPSRQKRSKESPPDQHLVSEISKKNRYQPLLAAETQDLQNLKLEEPEDIETSDGEDSRSFVFAGSQPRHSSPQKTADSSSAGHLFDRSLDTSVILNQVLGPASDSSKMASSDAAAGIDLTQPMGSISVEAWLQIMNRKFDSELAPVKQEIADKFNLVDMKV